MQTAPVIYPPMDSPKVSMHFHDNCEVYNLCRRRGDGGCAKERVHHIAGGKPAEQGLANHS
jgi:hypothetical protein